MPQGSKVPWFLELSNERSKARYCNTRILIRHISGKRPNLSKCALIILYMLVWNLKQGVGWFCGIGDISEHTYCDEKQQILFVASRQGHLMLFWPPLSEPLPQACWVIHDLKYDMDEKKTSNFSLYKKVSFLTMTLILKKKFSVGKIYINRI